MELKTVQNQHSPIQTIPDEVLYQILYPMCLRMDVTYAKYRLPCLHEGQGCSLRLPLVATGLASGLPPLEVCGTLIATTLVSSQPGSHDSRITATVPLLVYGRPLGNIC